MTTSKPYSLARAELVSEQLRRFSSHHVHQLAGHAQQSHVAFDSLQSSSTLTAMMFSVFLLG